MKLLRDIIIRIVAWLKKEESEFGDWLDEPDKTETTDITETKPEEEPTLMTFNEELLKQIFPPCREPEIWAEELNQVLGRYGIVTVRQIAAFLAQTGHESSYYNTLVENLNYSADALRRVFRKYFQTVDLAQAYARNPEKIANRVYANRMGNGDELSGDGWKYRGRGLIQVTGKNNYRACSLSLFGDDTLLEHPDWLIDPVYALTSACWYWESNNLNNITDFETLTRRINGGLNGLQHRLEIYNRALEVLSHEQD